MGDILALLEELSRSDDCPKGMTLGLKSQRQLLE